MEKENNKLKFTLIWSSCLGVLLLMVVLGVSSSVKGSYALDDGCSCPDGWQGYTGNNCVKYSDTYLNGYDCESNSAMTGYNYSCYTKATCNGGSSGSSTDSGKSCYCWGPTTAGKTCGYLTVTEANAMGDPTLTKEDSSKCVTKKCYQCSTNSGLKFWGTQPGSGTNGCSTSWTTTTLNESQCLSTYQPPSSGTGTITTREGCYQCSTATHIKKWFTQMPASGTNGCNNLWETTSIDKSHCVTTSPPSGGGTTGGPGCYYVSSSSSYVWSETTIAGATKVDKSNCTACYLCGNSQSGGYIWGVPENTSGCVRQNLTENQCKEKMEDTTETHTVVFMKSVSSILETKTCKEENGGTSGCEVDVPSAPISPFGGWSTSANCQSIVIGPNQKKVTANNDRTYWPCGPTGGNGEPAPNPPADTPSGNPDPNPPTGNPSSNPDPGTSPDDNVTENPPTGQIAIFVVWVIAAAAIVYSVWYFKQIRES